ncbi:MAG: aminopeptidase P family protein [Nitrospirae bacterium]|nr:aminopeptidase P family protein [Nitrospirota bacterium]
MRLDRLRETLRRRRLSGFLVTDIINVRYLSGFRGSSGFVVVTGRKNVFVTDFRYREQAERELGAFGVAWDLVIEKGDRPGLIRRLASRLGVRSLGCEAAVPYDFFQRLSRSGVALRPVAGIIEKQRERKDRDEITLIRQAARRAEAAFRDIKGYLKVGRREREIAFMLEERLKRRGCSRIPFDIIVASGANSAMPHARATDKKLSPGDLVVLDWGGEADGYCSDMTRTFLMAGGGTGAGKGRSGDLAKKREIYGHVLKANRKAVSYVAPGVESRSVDGAARKVIREAGYGEFFGHGTGHGVGLDVHELPRVSWRKSETIEEDMVFTVEPGIYLEGLGGVRIEDMVLVKTQGAKLLTTLPRSLEVL